MNVGLGISPPTKTPSMEVSVPLYEYKCAVCGHRFEIRQGIREAALTECPECTGAIRRVVHPVGIVFKGSGFYKTDSRTASEASVPAGEKKSEQSSDTQANGSSDKAGEGTGKAKESAPTPAANGAAGASNAPPAPTSTTPSKAAASGKTD
jgi:putative FmdB family regulatory protein